MKRLLIIANVVLLAAAPASAQDWAKARLDKSPRHQEWVKVKQGDRDVDCFLVFPEVKDKATAVVVICEIFGMTDWVRDVADQLAEAGYIAIAPDFLSPKGPGADSRRAISNLPPQQVTGDLNAAVDYVAKLPACNGKVVVAGFCWGGGQAFRFATNNRDIKAAFAFYGQGPNREADIARINCPVYGFYGGNDARVNATIPKSAELMKAAGKIYEPVTYEGAGHGFMRAGEDPKGSAANRKAQEEAWIRWKELLKKI